ncbi:hypothetical protein HPB50_015999 [Hyalomma asiaticum]|uniref:Uncharacterized protein n=1 Tax=Hyalomma asiaticum TaxID=266040 RepID=A0ACB7T8C6_HYAAI|nr:hypothetical protein HPB50_015999 [Hyalomma asiaticum]
MVLAKHTPDFSVPPEHGTPGALGIRHRPEDVELASSEERPGPRSDVIGDAALRDRLETVHRARLARLLRLRREQYRQQPAGFRAEAVAVGVPNAALEAPQGAGSRRRDYDDDNDDDSSGDEGDTLYTDEEEADTSGGMVTRASWILSAASWVDQWFKHAIVKAKQVRLKRFLRIGVKHGGVGEGRGAGGENRGGGDRRAGGRVKSSHRDPYTDVADDDNEDYDDSRGPRGLSGGEQEGVSGNSGPAGKTRDDRRLRRRMDCIVDRVNNCIEWCRLKPTDTRLRQNRDNEPCRYWQPRFLHLLADFWSTSSGMCEAPSVRTDGDGCATTAAFCSCKTSQSVSAVVNPLSEARKKMGELKLEV